MKVKCLAQELSVMPQVRVRSQTAQSGVRRANYNTSLCRHSKEPFFRVKFGENVLPRRPQIHKAYRGRLVC